MANIVSPKVRILYPSLFTPAVQMDGSTTKYECTILIPKSDKRAIKAFEDAIQETIDDALRGNGKTKFTEADVRRKTFFTPLRDGDEDKMDNDIYAGMMFLKAKSNRKPKVVDAKVKPIEDMDADEVYSGIWGRVSINFYPFDVSGSKGIAAGLGNVQKVADGEHLGGGSSDPMIEFEVIDEEDDDIFG